MATINGTAGNDTLTGTGAIDTINGYDGDDILTTGGGKGNVLNGGNGNDYLISTGTTGSGSGNTLNGGAGNDTYYFDETSWKYIINDTSGTRDTIRFGANIAYGDLTLEAHPSSNYLIIRTDITNNYIYITGQQTETVIEFLSFADGSIYS